MFGEPLQHRFSVFSTNNNLFPLTMHAKAREFIVRQHQQQQRLASTSAFVLLEEILAKGDESWALPVPATSTSDGNGNDAPVVHCPRVVRERLLPDFEFMGAFLW